MNLQIQKGQEILRKISNKCTAKHFVVKLQNIKKKKKAARENKTT